MLLPLSRRAISVAICFTAMFSAGRTWGEGPSHVEVRHAADGCSLYCDGNPFFIQGAGGDGSRELLKECGGNSLRLWGADHIDATMTEANKLGLKVAVGIWLEHVGAFSYHNPAQVAQQFERARQTILRYRDNPAVLLWGIGNEMEGASGDDPAVWAAVQHIASMAHNLDHNHPTMTVTAELGGKKVPFVEKYCPDIDIMGINSYAGVTSVVKRYLALGGKKPYIITEFGPAGQWESPTTSWKAPLELTSTQKAEAYRAAYIQAVVPEKGKLCLGSYAFLWGNKQEATATWFGMLLPDGNRLASVDVMQEMWTGHQPQQRCPTIAPIRADRTKVNPGEEIHATLDCSSTSDKQLTAEWVLTVDPQHYITQGDVQQQPSVCDGAMVSADTRGATIRMPDKSGAYWLYAYVRDGNGRAATAVLPVRVIKPHVTNAAPAAVLPAKLYADDLTGAPYIWSGWMGDAASLALDDKCTDHPHSGNTCMKCQFKAEYGFGGIAGQSPANDWGSQPGGLNLTGAARLTFWARGAQGGEVVSFKLGILGSDKKYADSDHAELADVNLTSDWKQYTIDLAGKDLSCIKTGFVWVVVATGKPVTFYLDDIQYE